MTDESPLPIEPHVVEASRRRKLPSQRAEALRTTFWLAPVILVLVAVGLFAVTFAVDVAAYHHQLTLPFWVRTGSADAGRQVLIAIAAAVITVIGVVFSITILALTLASQQFGPRMMRNFMRDLGNQLTLGVFVGTFVYAVLALGFISGSFVPHLSITVSEALLLVDLGVLIYFIHHIATSIQLPEVIAKIAADLFVAIDDEFPLSEGAPEPEVEDPPGRTAEDLGRLLDDRGVAVPAAATGYLQFVAYGQLVKIATRVDAVIRLSHRPGHFVLAGRPLAEVWPAGAAGQVHQALTKAHLTGPHRTLSQDPVFAIDQLVEIAIRALSPAVNDTFSALTCIDWLSAGLCRVSGRILDEGVFRDDSGRIRLVEPDPSYARMVNRAFDKVRQAAEGMPAVVIRLLDSLTHVVEYTRRPAQRSVLLRQAEMVLRGAERSITEPEDLADVRRRYEQVVTTAQRMGQSPGGDGSHPAGRSTEAGPGASASSRTRSIASTPPTGGPVVGDG